MTGLHRASGEALRVGWKPCTLAAMTTALGLLVAVRQQHPADPQVRHLLRHWRVGHADPVVHFSARGAADLAASAVPQPRTGTPKLSLMERGIDRFWQRAGGWVVRSLCRGGSGLPGDDGACGWGVRRIEPDVQLLKMFDAECHDHPGLPVAGNELGSPGSDGNRDQGPA